jgi:hypothetical protein
MLATQSVEGDLFLWSVSRQLREAPRVIRSLKRSESSSAEPKWLAWSKNGRIIQYADGYVSRGFLSPPACVSSTDFVLQVKHGRGMSERSMSRMTRSRRFKE